MKPTKLIAITLFFSSIFSTIDSFGQLTTTPTNIGIGESSPLTPLHIKAPTLTGKEHPLRIKVADAPTDIFEIYNNSATTAQFAPAIWSHREIGVNNSLIMIGSTINSADAGLNAIVQFDARKYSSSLGGSPSETNMSSSSVIITRPLFDWSNNLEIKMRLSATGNLGIGMGNLIPQARLDVFNENNPIAFQVNNSTLNLLYVGDNGKVGIGTTNPAQTLDISRGDFVIGGTGLYGGVTKNRLLFHTRDWVGGDYFSIVPFKPGTTEEWENALNIVPGKGIGIGTTEVPSTAKLAVKGRIYAEGLTVKSYGNWPDYVFAANYKLMPLNEVEQFIKTNKHLPGVPNAQTVEETGIDVAENQRIMMEKIEQLTLYIIEINKQKEALKAKVDQMEQEIVELSK